MAALLTFLIKLTIFEIQTVIIRLGMPVLLNEEELSRSTVLAKGLSNFQPSKGTGKDSNNKQAPSDPGAGEKISPEDLAVIKEQFPNLCKFSDDFLRFRTVAELLSIESTSIRIKDAERSRETEDRLATNKAGLLTRFYAVAEGRDNRCTELHPARFLPGAACSAARQFITAREVIGLTSPPPLHVTT